MPKFTPVIDNNSKNVYRWVRVSEDGSKTKVDVPQSDWKPISSWTSSEIEALFSSDVIVIQNPIALFDAAPDVPIDVAPELVEIPAESVSTPVTEEPQNSFQESSEAPTPTFFGITNN
jgi:hypothetical protein